ncbi:beta-hydroxyacid dehydrogenase, 3-hydroxyisobutyrate dehydrogenase [Frankia sp. QA3]|nr:beta-hydroxyacid dehydrogenase, 3-hydroxyisobutyrate dehydrogenase [Frankia sp. QA3]
MTVLGLGPMGSALAAAFLTAGHPTTVWNRSPGKAEPLVARGAALAASPAEAVAASPLTVVCVLDHQAVETILAAVGDALRGRVLVNLTSDSPDRSRTLAARSAADGIAHLEGSVMTPASTIGGPAASVLYSGPESLYRAQAGTLAAIGGSATFLGPDPGRAAAYDMALLDVFWTAMSGVVHAFALAGAEGIRAGDLSPFAQGVSGLLASIIDDFAGRIDEGRHDTAQSTVLSAAAGMRHIIHTARARDLDTGVLDAAEALARRAIDAGHGADGFSRLAQTLTPGAT